MKQQYKSKDPALEKTSELLISDLGWTYEQAVETRQRLIAFEEDWDVIGMEEYDKF